MSVVAALAVDSLTSMDSRREAIKLHDRQTDELVLGFIGPVGSGVSTVARIFGDLLEREYGYTLHNIRVSDLIRKAALAAGLVVPARDAELHETIAGLQLAGNQLRSRASHRYLAEKCVEQIAVDRHAPPPGIHSGYAEETSRTTPRLPLRRRRVHLIDSLKHPAEVGLLRDVYGDTFWLVGVFAPQETRETRLKRRKHAAAELSRTIEADESDGLDYGQKVRDAGHLADFFIRNDGDNEDRIRSTVARFLHILFNIGVNTPTHDEIAMAKADAQAATSACMSRQVGAAIYSRNRELIGVGANDVPKSRGGLYCTEDGEHDHRCSKWLGQECHNDSRKKALFGDIFLKLSKAGLLVTDATTEAVEAALRKTDVKNLIEYSRAVHAEMEAIISVARAGKAGLVGATLYSTTFPCHSCARHIVDAGISRVIYIEPYAKSLALDLHGDSVAVSEREEGSKTIFLQYEGVAPRNMTRLFKHGQHRKENGIVVRHAAKDAWPVFPAPLDAFSTREKIVLDRLEIIEEKKLRGASNGGDKPSAA